MIQSVFFIVAVKIKVKPFFFLLLFMTVQLSADEIPFFFLAQFFLKLCFVFFSILKVGVAIIDDAKKLRRDYDISVCGCVDLRNVLKQIRYNYKW